LENVVFANFCVLALEKVLCFQGEKFGPPNFQKDFFGRFGEDQGLIAEKIWNPRSFDFGASVP